MKSKLNIEPSTIYCDDNLDVLREINSECIDLIYLDPPFNKKKVFTAPVGSSAEGASFDDIFTKDKVKDSWFSEIKEEGEKDESKKALYELLDFARKAESRNNYNFYYLCYMSIRMIEMHRVLNSSGGGGHIPAL